MMKYIRTLGMAAMLFALVCRVEAQTAQVDTLSIPYIMSFEEADSVELKKWVLNHGPQAAACKDKWMVGTDTKSDGKRSLYISDNGVTAHFGVKPNLQFAYRDMVLPQGKYTISFDWKCMGANNAMLYVGCGPATNLPCNAANNNGNLDNFHITWCQPATRQLKGSRYWQNARLERVNSSGNLVIRLFFAWSSNNTDTTLRNPVGACIDNIQISKSDCPPPTDVEVETDGDTTTITWKGFSEFYEVGYRRVGDEHWNSFSNITATYGEGHYYFPRLKEGMYDFRVRGVCSDTLVSVYTYNSSAIIFRPEEHCINYVNIHDTTGSVICRNGHINSSGVIDRNVVGCIDYGPDDISSRHTVNWDIDAYDARTGYRLPIIAPDELASIRLGNWDDGGEWESITYNYLVDSAYSILLLKYAVVLEDPGHGTADQPRFTLSIKDQSGAEVDAECGSADFHAGAAAGNKGDWHYEPNLSWKEWTTYGINLTRFVGQTLQITITTYDCTWQGHYGYAYFCLGCAKAKIEGVSCGNDAKMTAQAPKGFKYEWSPISKLDSIVSTNQELEVEASDTSTYRCRLTYMDQPGCHFDLFSSVLPRFPIAEFEYKYEPSNCENRVSFTNKSHIMVKYEGDTTGTHHYEEKCDTWEWVIEGKKKSEYSPFHIFPNEGGSHIPVTLFAYIADKHCMDDTTIYIDVPAIGDVELEIADSICFGSTYTFGKQVIGQSGRYTETFKTFAECDSVCNLTLTVLPQNTTMLKDTFVCSNTEFSIDGDVYPYDYSRQWIRRLQNTVGCDSTVVQNVMLVEPLISTLPTVMPYQCAPEEGEEHTLSLPFDLQNDTALTYIYVYPSPEAQAAGFATSYTYKADTLNIVDGKGVLTVPLVGKAGKRWLPGTYVFTIAFQSKYNNCRIVEHQTAVNIRYGLSVVSQIYGYMFIQNSDLNGGYDFTSFQWYKNGQLLSGETRYYLEVPDDDLNNVFYCMVTRPDGELVSTCPIRYDYNTSNPKEWAENVDRDLTDLNRVQQTLVCAPTLVNQGGMVMVATGEPLTIYDMLGRRIESYVGVDGDMQLITAPMHSGIYLVQSKTGRYARIMVQ